MVISTHDTKKVRNRQYSIETMTDADYTDDLTIFPNTPAQEESLLKSLEQTAGGIDLNRIANKIQYMSLKQNRAIFTVSGKLLKLIDKFI